VKVRSKFTKRTRPSSRRRLLDKSEPSPTLPIASIPTPDSLDVRGTVSIHDTRWTDASTTPSLAGTAQARRSCQSSPFPIITFLSSPTSSPTLPSLLSYRASIILDSSSTTVIRPTLFAILRSSYQPQPNPIIDPSSFLTFLSQLKRSYPQAPEGTPEPPLNPIIDALADAVYFVEAQLEDQIALLPSDSPDKATKDKERAAWAEVCRMLLREGLVPTEVYDRFEVPFLDKMKLVANGIALTKKSTRKQTVALSVFFQLFPGATELGLIVGFGLTIWFR
jgi:hypothetical protein